MKIFRAVIKLFLFLLYTTSFVNAQNYYISDVKIQNLDFYQEGKKIRIHYDLLSSCYLDQFKIDVKIYNKNNKSISIKSVTGDLDHVKPGVNRNILWDVLTGLNKE